MARLIHVAATMLRTDGRAPTGSAATDAMPGRPARPRTADVLAPWFELSTTAPWVDSRVSPGVGVGVVAQLRVFGAMVGGGLGGGFGGGFGGGVAGGATLGGRVDGRGSGDEAVIGGNPSPLGAPPPLSVSEFARGCAVGLSLFAQGIGAHGQCLLLFGLHGRGPDDRADLQVFAGTAAVGTTSIAGVDQLPILLDLPPAGGSVSAEIWLRLCGAPDHAALGLRGVAGFLL